MFCSCMFFYFSEIHRTTLQHMLSYDQNRRAGVATRALLQQKGCLCCNKSLQRCACVATICCNGVLVLQETVATHFTVNDATRLDGSYHVLLQQTYAPGWSVLALCAFSDGTSRELYGRDILPALVPLHIALADDAGAFAPRLELLYEVLQYCDLSIQVHLAATN